MPVRHAAAELLGALATREDAKIQAVQVRGVWLVLDDVAGVRHWRQLRSSRALGGTAASLAKASCCLPAAAWARTASSTATRNLNPRSQVGAVPLLLLAASPSVPVPFATSAVAALGAITIRREGKYAALESPGGLAGLVSVLDPCHEQLCINAMTAVSNVAEAPEARAILVASGAVSS